MEHDMEVRKHKGAPPQIGPSSEQDPPKLFVCTYLRQNRQLHLISPMSQPRCLSTRIFGTSYHVFHSIFFLQKEVYKGVKLPSRAYLAP